MSNAALSRAQAWAIALVATLTMAISYLNRQVLAALGPTVTQALSLSEQQYGLLQSAFSLAYLVGTPFAGWLLDRTGVRNGLLFAVLLWTAVSAAHAFVPTFGALFGLRILLGLAESPSFPGAASAVSRALPPVERPRGLGILFTGSSIGAMIAPILATTIAAWFGWRSAFVGVALVGLVWVPLWLVATRSPAARAALGCLPPQTLSASDRTSTTGWRIVLHPAVQRASVLVLAVAPLFAFVLLWSAKFIVAEFDVRHEHVGRYLWLPPLLFDAGAITFGSLASVHLKKRPDGRPPRLLLSLCVVPMLALALSPTAAGVWSAVLLAGVALFGGGGAFAILTSDMIGRTGPERAATAGGITAATQSIAYIVANPLIGMGVEAFGGYAEVCVLVALWTVPGAIVWLLWKPPPVARRTNV